MKNLLANHRVEKIHNEFDDASDVLVEQARAIVNQETKSRTEMLRRIGMDHHPEVRSTRARSSTVLQALDYFAKNKLSYRLIQDEALDRIQKKYKLACEPISKFVGVIPTLNLEEAAHFMANVRPEMVQKDLVSSSRIFRVVAEQKDFKLEDNEHWVNGAIQKKPEPRDPVILMPLSDNEHWIIVTKWGKEADYAEFNK